MCDTLLSYRRQGKDVHIKRHEKGPGPIQAVSNVMLLTKGLALQAAAVSPQPGPKQSRPECSEELTLNRARVLACDVRLRCTVSVSRQIRSDRSRRHAFSFVPSLSGNPGVGLQLRLPSQQMSAPTPNGAPFFQGKAVSRRYTVPDLVLSPT